MNIQYFVITLFLVSVFSPIHAGDNQSKSHCSGGICVEDGTIELTNDDIHDLKEILSKDELPDLNYQVVTIKSIIVGSVYLLSASKPDYYGIQVVLSKEGTKWHVLKKVKSIY